MRPPGVTSNLADTLLCKSAKLLKNSMQRLIGLLWLCALASPVLAQDFPKAELFGGYQFGNVEINGTTRENVNGGLFSVSGNFSRRFALETEVGIYHEALGDGGGTANVYSYLAGPHINFRQHPRSQLFLHSLLGFDHAHGTDFGLPVSDTAIGAALGGGAEWRVSDRVGVRTSLDYLLAHYSVTQNNIRAVIGFSYSWGEHKPAKAKVKKDDDRLFQRKIECSKFLEHLPASDSGKDASDQESRTNVEPPVVFYSPTLDTCLYINQILFSKERRVNAKVIDLLTGRTVEDHWFDLSGNPQSYTSKGFEQATIERYGGSVP
jgi:hypothetical protein